MTIKEVSEKFGIPADTLRYYERVGMIPPVHRTESGIRDYTEDDIGWVQLSVCMRSAGLPVEVMIEYLKLFQAGDDTIPTRLQAGRHIPMTMEDWAVRLDRFLEFNEHEILQDSGRVTHEIAKSFAQSQFEKYRIVQDKLFQSDFDHFLELAADADKLK